MRAVSGFPRRCEADAWEEEQRGFYRARRWLAKGKPEGLLIPPHLSAERAFGDGRHISDLVKFHILGASPGAPKKSFAAQNLFWEPYPISPPCVKEGAERM